MMDPTSQSNLNRILNATSWSFVVHPSPTAKIAWHDPFAPPVRPRNRAELVLHKIQRWREGNPR